MKALILIALALSPTYFAGAILLREYWVVTPPLWFWATLGLCTAAAFAALPLVNQWLFAAEDALFVLWPGALLEPVAAATGLPSFRPAQSIDFWASRKPGARYTLQMRRLPWGYWQYGVDAFRPEIEAFEDPPRQ